MKAEPTSPSPDSTTISAQISPVKTPRGKKRVKPEVDSDGEENFKVTKSPKKKATQAVNEGGRTALPAPFVPDSTITAANDPRLMCAIVERKLVEVGGKFVAEVAAEFGVDAGKLNMNWRNTARKKIILAVRREFVGEKEST